MIPQENKPIVAEWIGHEASLLGEEIIWQDEWLGYYKATRQVGDITFVIECTAVQKDAPTPENVEEPTCKRYRTYPNAVWCDVHCTHHARDTNPYNLADQRGHPLRECGPESWRNLTILAEPDEEF